VEERKKYVYVCAHTKKKKREGKEKEKGEKKREKAKERKIQGNSRRI
jgi:hypothetical protein